MVVDFAIGDVLTNKDLTEIFHCGNMGGNASLKSYRNFGDYF